MNLWNHTWKKSQWKISWVNSDEQCTFRKLHEHYIAMKCTYVLTLKTSSLAYRIFANEIMLVLTTSKTYLQNILAIIIRIKEKKYIIFSWNSSKKGVIKCPKKTKWQFLNKQLNKKLLYAVVKNVKHLY